MTRTGLHTILRNPFYTGVMRIRASGETYEGNHELLISKSLFDRVQNILHGRVGTRVKIHDCTYRRYITCAACGNHLIGELQKGRVYYRCHTKACPKTSVREDAVEAMVVKKLRALEFSESEKAVMLSRIGELKASWVTNKERELQNVKLKIEQVTERLNRLTDAYLEGALDRSMFEERKAMLIAERRAMNDRLADYQANRVSAPDELRKFVELAGSAYSLYRNAATEKKRRLLRIVMSNCIIQRKEINITWQIPFRQVADRENETDGAPCCEIGRTFSPEISRLADELFAFFIAGRPELDLSILD